MSALKYWPTPSSCRRQLCLTQILTRLDRYHWALLVGPKKENPGPVVGQRYHVINQPVGPKWKYEAGDVKDVLVTAQLLVRVTIAKVVDEQRLIDILRTVPVDPTDWDGRGNGREPKWTCRIWLIAALKAIRADGHVVGTNVLDNIEGPGGIIERARAFVAGHIQNGRYSTGRDAMKPKPLLDMITGQEAYP